MTWPEKVYGEEKMKNKNKNRKNSIHKFVNEFRTGEMAWYDNHLLLLFIFEHLYLEVQRLLMSINDLFYDEVDRFRFLIDVPIFASLKIFLRLSSSARLYRSFRPLSLGTIGPNSQYLRHVCVHVRIITAQKSGSIIWIMDAGDWPPVRGTIRGDCCKLRIIYDEHHRKQIDL